MSHVVEELGNYGNWTGGCGVRPEKKIFSFTDSGEEHVVQEQSNGHYDEDKFPGLPGWVEIRPDIGAGDVFSSLGTHPDSPDQLETSDKLLQKVLKKLNPKIFQETKMV